MPSHSSANLQSYAINASGDSSPVWSVLFVVVVGISVVCNILLFF